jgi:hypothetical protein
MSGLFDRLQDEINARQKRVGLSPVDLLDLPADLAAVIRKIVRQNGLRLADIAAELNQAPADVQQTLDELEKKGFVRHVEVQGDLWYKARFGRKADKSLSASVWGALDKVLDQDDSEEQAPPVRPNL